MDWYEMRQFGDRLKEIEQFFVEIAANEESLRLYGFEHALSLPTSSVAIEALGRFTADYSAFRRISMKLDRTLAQEVSFLDSEGKITEQVSLILLRLRMAVTKKETRLVTPSLFILLANAMVSGTSRRKHLFGDESVSLQKTIVNIGRLMGQVNAVAEISSTRGISDDAVFKPSNVEPDRVIDLIDSAIEQIAGLKSISPSDREKIEAYLFEAKKEASTSAPSWPKIVGALVIVAAITSGIADAPNASKTIKEVIEYILGASVENPLQKYLPPPNPPADKQSPSTLVA